MVNQFNADEGTWSNFGMLADLSRYQWWRYDNCAIQSSKTVLPYSSLS